LTSLKIVDRSELISSESFETDELLSIFGEILRLYGLSI
jgi:hypothetical protein